MNPATAGSWKGGYSGQDIDGVDMWSAVTTGADSSRTEVVHMIGDTAGDQAVILYNNVKYMKGVSCPDGTEPQSIFAEDLDSAASRMACDAPVFSYETEAIHIKVADAAPASVFGRTADIAISVTGIVIFFSLTVLMFVFQRNINRQKSIVKAENTPADSTVSYQSEEQSLLTKGNV
jgi:hypothetical protein